jgi:hypothetical protein
MGMLEHELYTWSPGDDPTGAHGKAFFTAVVELERWRAIRSVVAWLLAAASVPCWVIAMWPDLLHGPSRRVPLALWALFLALLVYSQLATRRWHRALNRDRASGSRPPPR